MYKSLLIVKLKAIKESSIFRKYLSVLILDILSKGIPYLLLPLFTQIMTPKDFGLYTFLIYLTTSLQNILRLGTDTTQAKLFYEYPSKGTLIFNLTFIVLTTFLFIYSILTYLGLDKVLIYSIIKEENLDYSNVILAVWINTLFLILYLFLNTYYQLTDQIIKFQFFNFLKSVTANGFIILLIIQFWSNNIGSKRLIFEAIIGFLIFAPLIIKYTRSFIFKFDTRIIKKAIKIGFPIFLTSVISFGLIMYDKYFLTKIFKLEKLAEYNFTLMLCLPVSLILSSVNSLWIPKFFREKNRYKQIQDTKKLIYYLIFVYLILFLFVFIALAIIDTYGYLKKEYQNVYTLLPFSFLAFSLDAFTNIISNFFIQNEKTSYILIISTFTLFIFVVLSKNLIPIYAEYGAILSLLIISIMRFISYLYFVNKVL